MTYKEEGQALGLGIPSLRNMEEKREPTKEVEKKQVDKIEEKRENRVSEAR